MASPRSLGRFYKEAKSPVGIGGCSGFEESVEKNGHPKLGWQHKQRNRSGTSPSPRGKHEQTSLNRQYLDLVEEKRVLILKMEKGCKVLPRCLLPQ